MKSGSASIERQEETQAPHWMQAIDWVMSIIDSGSTMYSRSGGSPAGSNHGVTRLIFCQCVDSMSVIRSLITGMFPIGSTIIGAVSSAPAGARSSTPSASRPGSRVRGPLAAVSSACERAPFAVASAIFSANSCASPSWVLQPRPD